MEDLNRSLADLEISRGSSVDIEFQYSALLAPHAQFRLLKLQGASGEDATIHGTLVPKDLDAAPSYEALSYTWGREPPSRVIMLDGCSFLVTPNLEQALLHLRCSSEARYLWIDAICVNQLSLKEKSKQLPLMRDIYSTASTVLIWLGGLDEDVACAFDYIQDRFHIDENGERHAQWPWVGDDSSLVAIHPGIEKLFNNAWWTRMWTAQELVVAGGDPVMVLGHRRLEWSALSSFITFMTVICGAKSEALNLNMEPIYGIKLLREVWEQTVRTKEKHDKGDVLRLENLLLASSERYASDPKDKVFAVLSMLPPGKIVAFTQNYEQSTNFIFQQAMVEALRSSGDLDFLQHAVLSGGRDSHDLPSWCLDFSIWAWNRHRGEFTTFLLRDKEAIKELGFFTGIHFGRELKVDHNVEKGSLRVLGTCIGKVHLCHASSTETVSLGPKTLTKHALSKHILGMDSDLRTSRAMRAFNALLQDYKGFWVLMGLALTIRLGTEKAGELIRGGVIWRVFRGGIKKSTEDDLNEKLRRMCPKEEEAPEYFAVMREWAEIYQPSRESEDSRVCENELVAEERLECRETDPAGDADGPRDEHSGETQPDEVIDVGDDIDKVFEWMAWEVFGIASHATGKALFTTHNGYIGRAGHPVELGDIVCVLQGCKRPAVLRPYDEDLSNVGYSNGEDLLDMVNNGTTDPTQRLMSGRKFQLVTFAYVHDVFEDSETALDLAGREPVSIELY